MLPSRFSLKLLKKIMMKKSKLKLVEDSNNLKANCDYYSQFFNY